MMNLMYGTIILGVPVLFAAIVYGVRQWAPGSVSRSGWTGMGAAALVIALVLLHLVTPASESPAEPGGSSDQLSAASWTKKVEEEKAAKAQAAMEMKKFRKAARKWLSRCCPLGRGNWRVLNLPVRGAKTDALGGRHLLPFNTGYLVGPGKVKVAIRGSEPLFGSFKNFFVGSLDGERGINRTTNESQDMWEGYIDGQSSLYLNVEFSGSFSDDRLDHPYRVSVYDVLITGFEQPPDGEVRHFAREMPDIPEMVNRAGKEVDPTYPGPLVKTGEAGENVYWSLKIYWLPPLLERSRIERKLVKADLLLVAPKVQIRRGDEVIWEIADPDDLDLEMELCSEEVSNELLIPGPLKEGDRFYFSGSNYTLQLAYLIRNQERAAP